jgi:putative membrane protein
MFHRSFRVLPALVAAVTAGLIASGSFALAHDSGQESEHHQSSGLKRCDRSCQGKSFSAWDEQWLMMSIEGDLFEIQGGKIALHKATTPEVKTLAKTLIKDHTKSLADAIEVAKHLGIDVPDSPSPTQQWELNVVSTFSGKTFDRWYSDLEVRDHIQDIQEAKDEVEKGCNDEVQDLAEDDIPVLQKHLELAQAALAAAGGSPAS